MPIDIPNPNTNTHTQNKFANKLTTIISNDNRASFAPRYMTSIIIMCFTEFTCHRALSSTARRYRDRPDTCAVIPARAVCPCAAAQQPRRTDRCRARTLRWRHRCFAPVKDTEITTVLAIMKARIFIIHISHPSRRQPADSAPHNDEPSAPIREGRPAFGISYSSPACRSPPETDALPYICSSGIWHSANTSNNNPNTTSAAFQRHLAYLNLGRFSIRSNSGQSSAQLRQPHRNQYRDRSSRCRSARVRFVKIGP